MMVLELGEDASGDPRDADLVRVLDASTEEARAAVAVARSLGVPVEWEDEPGPWARQGGGCRYCLQAGRDTIFDEEHGSYYHRSCRRAVQ